MKKHERVIVGGSAAGVQAAICAQRHYGFKDILVICREQTVMVPCGIPYIYGTLGDVDKNVLPDRLLGDAQKKVGAAVSIDPEEKLVVLNDGEKIGYNKLILATGSNPLTPRIEGINKDNVYFVKKDADYLRKLNEAVDKANHIVVVGGGFIGVELAEQLRKRGRQVTIVELLPHCLQLVCPEQLCIKAEEALKNMGVNLVTGTSVKSIRGNSKVESVELDNGEQIKCDMVVIAIGVTPETGLAKQAGLEIGPTGGIKVDEFQRSSKKDIFAIGDCAEKYSFYNGSPVPIRLASVAAREGRIAVANLYAPRWREWWYDRCILHGSG